MNNPTCPACKARLQWFPTLRAIIGVKRSGSALWGLLCPACGADLKVPNSRALLIAAAGIFFGSQTSILLTLGHFTFWPAMLVKLWLILGFYALAIWFFLNLEQVT